MFQYSTKKKKGKIKVNKSKYLKKSKTNQTAKTTVFKFID